MARMSPRWWLDPDEPRRAPALRVETVDRPRADAAVAGSGAGGDFTARSSSSASRSRGDIWHVCGKRVVVAAPVGDTGSTGGGSVYYPGIYISGGHNRETTIFGGRSVWNEDLVNLPTWLVLKLRIQSEDAIRLDNVEALDYRHTYDIRSRYREFEGRHLDTAMDRGRRRCRRDGSGDRS